ncbi:MAG: aliphatic sulfonate ABC transporter substrate-binding protein [Chthoniobacteraceae bacterium]
MKHLKTLLSAAIGAAIATSAHAETNPSKITLDYAYWSPTGLVLKEKKFLEDDLAKDNIKVEWVFSQGSNKSLEYLNSKSTDFGSSAGVAALISRSNGNPIKSVYVLSKPEWTALLVRKDSPIKSVADLKGKKVAATRGTDPFVFLARALDQNGLTIKDIEYVALQHADGKTAFLRGDVDAWAGLDPLMAQAELEGAQFLYRNADANTYNLASVREQFAKEHPALIVRIIKAYEKARQWAIANPAEYKALVAASAKLGDQEVTKVLERTDLSSPLLGEAQKKSIGAAGDVLKKNGVITSTVDVNKTLDDLFDPQFVNEAVK